MTSTGNDIVALTSINVSRIKQPNFHSRIISSIESDLYYSDLEEQLAFEHFVWLAWSVKESTYKYLKRFDTGLIFSSPKMRIVELRRVAEYLHGAVQCGDQMLYFQSLVTNEFIFSIVNDTADFSETYWDIKQIDSADPAAQSSAVRELLLEKLVELFPATDLQITKSPYGWPIIANEEGELPTPVSFTHHDNFVAYSFQLTDSLWKAHQHHAEVL